MASVFPGGIDNFVDPLIGSPLNSPSHALQHQNVNDAVEKIETYMGLVKVVPTSAVNGTVSATGTVTIGNAVSSVTVNGAFSSLYNNYKIIVSGGVGSSAQFMRLQIGTANTLYYSGYSGVNYSTNATENANVNNGSLFLNAGIMDLNNINMGVELFSPFLAKPTYVNGFIATSGRGGAFAGYLNDLISYTTFAISPTSGTMTGGTITVYGYRN